MQALAGTCPVPWQCGEDATVQMRFACLKPRREALHPCAWLSMQQEPWAQAYDQCTRAEGKRQRMAVRALAPVVVRIIFALWLKQEAYQRATIEKAQRPHPTGSMIPCLHQVSG